MKRITRRIRQVILVELYGLEPALRWRITALFQLGYIPMIDNSELHNYSFFALRLGSSPARRWTVISGRWTYVLGSYQLTDPWTQKKY